MPDRLLLFMRSRRAVLICAIMSTGIASGCYSRAHSASQADLDCDPIVFSGKQDAAAQILHRCISLDLGIPELTLTSNLRLEMENADNRSENEHEGNAHCETYSVFKKPPFIVLPLFIQADW